MELDQGVTDCDGGAAPCPADTLITVQAPVQSQFLQHDTLQTGKEAGGCWERGSSVSTVMVTCSLDPLIHEYSSESQRLYSSTQDPGS